MKKISVLIPCYNEEASLPLLYTELVKVMDSCKSYDWEVLFINDGSRDNTLSVIKALRQKDMRISYVDLSRNFGKENAICTFFGKIKRIVLNRKDSVNCRNTQVSSFFDDGLYRYYILNERSYTVVRISEN